MLLWRLNLSPYHQAHFSTVEEKVAQKQGLAYAWGEAGAKLAKQHDQLILITNTHSQPSELTPSILERTRLLIHPNSGFDNFSYQWTQQQRFPIVLGNRVRSHAVSNTILSHLLHHYSPLHHQSTWDPDRLYPRKLLKDLTILILGYGHIGRLLEQALEPLAKNILISDPLQGIAFQPEYLKADIIIPVASLTASSRHLINEDFLRALPHDFCLINCSRGPIVDTEALIHHLAHRPQAHAYIDVFEQEPVDFAAFTHLPNLSCTSHIAGVFTNIDQSTLDFEEQVIGDYQSHSLDDFNNLYKRELLNTKSQENYL